MTYIELTNLGLVEFVKSKLGTPYLYGAKGEAISLAKFKKLKSLYGNLIWNSDISKVGHVCCDCSGLISWYTGIQRGSTQFKNAAKKVHPISTINSAPIGAAVWRQGHIGVYIGNGYYIAEDGSAYGCRKNKITNANFTHWFEISDIKYIKEVVDDEVVESSKIKINGQYYTVSRILKDGTNYIKIRDLEKAGFKISNEGNIAIIEYNAN